MSTATTADEHRVLIGSFFKALRRGDHDGLRSVFSADAQWHVPRSGGIEDPRGVDNVIELLTGAPQEFYRPETASFEFNFMIVENNHAAVQFRMKCTTARGTDYDNLYVFAFQFADGRIVEGWEHTDTAYWQAKVRGAFELA